jgi:hypothetical protein
MLEPLFRLLSRVFFKLMGYACSRFGTLAFWGAPNFLATCTTALQRLQELDSELHVQLTTKQRLVFYYSPNLEQAYGVWFFSINDSYLSYHADGIIARLVYSSWLAALCPRRGGLSNAASQMLHSEVDARTRSWLEMHRFPEPLIDCFRSANDAT